MPYYDETFENRVTFGRQICHWNANMTNSSRQPADLVQMRSYRTRPHFAAKTSTEVSDTAADPYAFFLAQNAEKDYAKQLAARGLPAVGTPDRGHAFELRRTSMLGSRHTATSLQSNGALDWTYENAYFVPQMATSPTTLGDVHNGTIFGDPTIASVVEKFGQTAYAKTAPTAVMWDAARFLGELREGLPNLARLAALKGKLSGLKGVGDLHLGIEFGLAPIIRDYQDAAAALVKATQHFDSSHMNQRVHRKYGVPMESLSGTSTSLADQIVVSASGVTPQASAPFGAEARVVKTFSRRLWFEGEFTSFLPLDFDPSDFLKRADQLINTKITARTLWELAPWSWLVDWSLRIGDSIAANELAANDRLIMHYGYAMEHIVTTTSASWWNPGTPNPNFKWVGLPVRSQAMRTWERKKRIRANPYGFKTGSWGGLSVSQSAILAALGLSKGVR